MWVCAEHVQRIHNVQCFCSSRHDHANFTSACGGGYGYTWANLNAATRGPFLRSLPIFLTKRK